MDLLRVVGGHLSCGIAIAIVVVIALAAGGRASGDGAISSHHRSRLAQCSRASATKRRAASTPSEAVAPATRRPSPPSRRKVGIALAAGHRADRVGHLYRVPAAQAANAPAVYEPVDLDELGVLGRRQCSNRSILATDRASGSEAIRGRRTGVPLARRPAPASAATIVVQAGRGRPNRPIGNKMHRSTTPPPSTYIVAYPGRPRSAMPRRSAPTRRADPSRAWSRSASRSTSARAPRPAACRGVQGCSGSSALPARSATSRREGRWSGARGLDGSCSRSRAATSWSATETSVLENCRSA